MKVMYSMALAMAAVALVATSAPLRASETDARIESSFTKSYVYKTYLKDEHIKISSKDGAVTLSGDVYNETTNRWPRTPPKRCPGSRPLTIVS